MHRDSMITDVTYQHAQHVGMQVPRVVKAANGANSFYVANFLQRTIPAYIRDLQVGADYAELLIYPEYVQYDKLLTETINTSTVLKIVDLYNANLLSLPDYNQSTDTSAIYVYTTSYSDPLSIEGNYNKLNFLPTRISLDMIPYQVPHAVDDIVSMRAYARDRSTTWQRRLIT
ncbi:hypothetical protein J6590_091873 [Homalodisca vitripennis]|nr:hypothetical protein J6590_091873 [Homalodisca vitripennis]